METASVISLKISLIVRVCLLYVSAMIGVGGSCYRQFIPLYIVMSRKFISFEAHFPVNFMLG